MPDESLSSVNTASMCKNQLLSVPDEDLPVAGKSTLLKLMCGDLTPTRGDIKRHSHLVIGRYHQHSVDVLDDKMEVWLAMSTSCP